MGNQMLAKFLGCYPVPTIIFLLTTATFAQSQITDNTGHESNDLHKIIATGVMQDFDELSIKAKFVFKRGIARSAEEGLNGEFFNPLTGEAGTREVANGVLIKLRESVRFQLNFECPSNYDSVNQTYQLVSDDTIIHGLWMVRRVPLQASKTGETFGNNTTVKKRATDPDFIEFTERSLFARYNPVFAPLRISRVVTNTEKYESNAEMIDQSTVNVKLKTNDGRQVESASFSTSGRFPTLIRTEGVNWTGVSLDVVQLPSGREIPRTFRHVLGPVKVLGYADSVWIANSWEAIEYTEDVSEKDFEIVLQPDEQFHGLPRPSDGVLDVFSVARNDLEASETNESTTSSAGSPNLRNYAWVFVAIAVVVLGVVLVYRRWFHVVACAVWASFVIGCGSSTDNSPNEFVVAGTRFDNKDSTSDTQFQELDRQLTCHHFGRLFVHSNSPEDRDLQCRFTIENSTANQMQLKLDGTKCGCLIPKIGKSTLDVNGKSELSMRFYPPLLPGHHQQSTFLTTSDSTKKSQSRYTVAVEIYPRLSCPASVSSVPLLDDSGKCELRVLAFSTELFEDDLVVNYDASCISMTSKCVLAQTWDSVYCREWNVSIKKLTKFKDGASLLTCKGNGSECTIQVRDTFKAFDVSSENVFMKRDSTKYPVVITVTPINVEVLGEVRYNTEWLEIHRVDNVDGTTDLQITPKHFGTQFHTHIELFQPFSEISDGTITLSCL